MRVTGKSQNTPYEIEQSILQKGKFHSTGEPLMEPHCRIVVKCMFGKDAQDR